MNRSLPVLSTVLAWLLAAFFLYGAWTNVFISAEDAAAYIDWGYPDWFHYITAILELTASLLLIRNVSRSYGAGLGALVMVAASLSALLHADYDHAIAPAIILLVALIVLSLSLTHGQRH